ncbi:PEP-CTERM protein-sorting domain-containing protein [Neorhodopirellula lusitana]|uniref:PEP-CTERM protein-sorting domain-containing protein n=1 Tax=Neorhodopirellula lusitana TaxID=445327 RepID=A0ABY1Q1J7_9BACT|nr:hypothetical protein [Neorhodopirellula lusitana]SMP55574.1 PEP-CTERM protein-sorting domain-containing protein [Neorhodopirellula lusitana]
MIRKAAFFFVLFTCLTLKSEAAIVTFNLLDPSGVAGTAGEDLETIDFTIASGVTLSEVATSTFAGGNGTGTFSANGTTAGVNTGGTFDDEASQFDAGETLTFTVNFSAPTIVTLTSIDFSGIGSDSSDSATVLVDGTSFELFTGKLNFNGSSDEWTPTIALTDGDTIAVSVSNVAALEAVSFDVTAVPEPSMAVFLFAVGGALIERRRRDARRVQ